MTLHDLRTLVESHTPWWLPFAALAAALVVVYALSGRKVT